MSQTLSKTAAWCDQALGWVLGVSLLGLALAKIPGLFWQDSTVPRLLILRLGSLVLLVLLGLIAWSRRGSEARVPWYLVIGGAFLGWGALASWLSGSPRASLFGIVFRYEGLAAYCSYFLFFLAARRIASRRFVPPTVALYIGTVVAGVLGLLGVVQQVWPADRPVEGLALIFSQRSFATFGNPIYYGLFACLALPLGVALLALDQKRARGPMLILAVAAVAAGGYFSYSRAFLLAAPIGCVLTLVLLVRSRERMPWLRFVAAALVAVLFVVAVQVARPKEAPRESSATLTGRVAETVQATGSLRNRLELYKGTVRLIGQRPVAGWGFETYSRQGPQIRTQTMVLSEGARTYPDRPHDSLLYIAFSVGILGLLLFLGFVLGAFAGACSGHLARHGPELVFSAGLLGGLVAYGLGELTVFSVIEVTPFFWAVFGWATASPAVTVSRPARGRVGRVLQTVGDSRLRLSPPVFSVLGAAALVLALGWAAFALPQAIGVARADNIHHTVLARTLSGADYEAAAGRELTAAGLDPTTPEYWNTAAILYEGLARTRQDRAVLAQARTALEKGLRSLPGDPTLTVTLSDVELAADRPQEAAGILERFLKSDPYQVDAHFNLALAYMTLNRPADAARQFETLLTVDPKDAEALYYLSKAYGVLGRRADADKALAKAVSIDPQYAGKK